MPSTPEDRLRTLKHRIQVGRVSQQLRDYLVAELYQSDPGTWTQSRLAELAGMQQQNVSKVVARGPQAPEKMIRAGLVAGWVVADGVAAGDVSLDPDDDDDDMLDRALDASGYPRRNPNCPRESDILTVRRRGYATPLGGVMARDAVAARICLTRDCPDCSG